MADNDAIRGTAQDPGNEPVPASKTLGWIGIAWMMGAICSNTLELTLVHYLGPGWPAPLQLFWRQGTALVLMMPIILSDPRGVLRISRPGILLFRSLSAMLGLLLSIYAYSRLPMATANALTFTRPLWIVLLAALFLREKVGWWRGGAILLGFAGVLVMVRPDRAGGEIIAELAILAAALLFAASFVSIKSMTGDSRTSTIIVYGVVFGLLLSAIPALREWRTPDPRQAMLLVGLGFASLGTFGFMAQALRMADATALVSLDYLRLPLATLVGMWLFGEVPTGSLFLGAGMIVAATATVTLRERMQRRRMAREV